MRQPRSIVVDPCPAPTHVSIPTAATRTLSLACLLLLLPVLLAAGSIADAAEVAADKAAATLAESIGRPHLLDGVLPSVVEAAREWVLGEKAYVGMLAGKDGESAARRECVENGCGFRSDVMLLHAHPVETKLCDPDVQSQSGYFKIAGSKDMNCACAYGLMDQRDDAVGQSIHA